MAESGIRIDGKLYALPGSLRVGETRTIKRLTGLNPPEFMVALAGLSETQDPDVGAAMVWWIMHREDPSVTPDQIDDLEWGAIEGESGEEADPKGMSATSASEPEISASSGNSAMTSSGTPEMPAGEPILVNGGAPASVPSDPPTWLN